MAKKREISNPISKKINKPAKQKITLNKKPLKPSKPTVVQPTQKPPSQKIQPRNTEKAPATIQQIPIQKTTPKKIIPKENDEEPAGQFLLTYGWAILVIVAAILVPFYSSITQNISFERCSIPKSSGLSCDSFNATSEFITLSITNLLDGNLVITGNSEIQGENNSCKINEDTLILAKNTSSLIFNADGSTGNCQALLANPKIKAEINITFKDINLSSTNTIGRLVARTQ